MVDIQATLVQHLTEVPGVAAVGTRAVDIEENLPFVQINQLPSSVSAQVWNGPRRAVIDRLQVDVDVYAADTDSAFSTAAAVRAFLDSDPMPDATVTAVPPFCPRPDFNERISRYGTTVTFTAKSY